MGPSKGNHRHDHGIGVTARGNEKSTENTTGLTTATESLKRKLPAIATEEPPAKKRNTNDTHTKATIGRCFTGNVGEIIEFSKQHPENAFYEVFAKVRKVTSSKSGNTLLLRTDNSGPIMQAIFWEVDLKMEDLQPGDSIRAVGRIQNESVLNIFKIRKFPDQCDGAYVRRLRAISNFINK